MTASKSLVKLAWRLAVDAQRTLAPLVYPPHEIALASLYVASMLATHIPLLSQHDTSNESDMSNVTQTRPPPEIASMLARSGSWEAQFHATAADIDGEWWSYHTLAPSN
jgi:CTD kinase subunit beta